MPNVERIRKLRDNFRDILGGAEAAEYEGSSPSNVNLQEQIGELIQPILGELREATSAPRELDALRKSLDLWTDRKSKADIIVSRIDELTTTIKDEALTSELESARRLWTGRQAEAAGQIGVINSQIRERESRQQSLWETLIPALQPLLSQPGHEPVARDRDRHPGIRADSPHLSVAAPVQSRPSWRKRKSNREESRICWRSWWLSLWRLSAFCSSFTREAIGCC